MVDYKCRKFSKQVEKHIQEFNSKNKQYQLKLAETSDELDCLPYDEAKSRVNGYLNDIEDNLGEYYTEYNSIINDVDETETDNDDCTWQAFKYLEMISTRGLFYIEVIENGECLGFFSFFVTTESLIKKPDLNPAKKVKLSFFGRPKEQVQTKNIFYLMEIQLKRKFTNKGVGKLVFNDFIFELSKEEKFDIEFVCFKKNDIGNKFYKKLGFSKHDDYQNTVVNKEMSEVINIYQMECNDIPQ